MDESKKNNVNKSSDKQRNNDLNSTALESRPQNREETNGEQKKKKPKEKVNCYRRIQSTSAIIMALCTLAIAGITAFYTYYASEQVDQMRDAVKSSSDTLIEMKNQFRLDQRAWVSVTKAGFREPLDASKVTNIDFTTRNSGKTPALRVKTYYRMWGQYKGRTISVGSKTPKYEMTYGPGDERTHNLSLDSHYSQDLINLLAKKVTFFIEIKLVYFDIYDIKKPHHTCACLYFIPESAKMAFCDTGTGCNYMD